MLSKGKIQAIGILRRKVFTNDEDYYMALDGFGVKSCKDLTERDASRFIAKLHELNGDSRPNTGRSVGRGVRGKQSRLTNEQAERIGILQSLLGWSDSGFYGFIKRQLGKNTGVEMICNWEAVKVIVGMQKILAPKLNMEYKTLNEMSNTEMINKSKNAKVKMQK